jgi:hypothetical protein
MGNNNKAYQFGGNKNRLLLEDDRSNYEKTSEGYDDNLSDYDRVVVVGGTSEYNQDQSFLSINRY